MKKRILGFVIALSLACAVPSYATVYKIAKATGNFTTAGTWGINEAGASATAVGFNSTQNLTTTETYTPAFTCTNTDVVDGVGMYVGTGGSTGTITVGWSNNSGVSDATTVTVNVSDLPVTATGNAWVFFVFGTPQTCTGVATYKIGLKTSVGASTVTFERNSATSGDWTRIPRTTTTGAPVAADWLFVIKELTGAGTSNARTVTMDNNNTTSFGQTEIGWGGVWTTSTAANTEVHFAGMVWVDNGATLNIGTSGSPIPRGTTSKFMFDCASDSQYGFNILHGSTVTIYGQSPTAGLTATWTYLTANAAATNTSLTISDTNVGWKNGDDIGIASTTRTYTQAETRTLSADATSTTLTISAGLSNAHSGTSPTQAEIVDLTRNVTVASSNSSNMTFVDVQGLAAFDSAWTLYRYSGRDAGSKFGLEFETTNGHATCDACVIRDSEAEAFVTNGTGSGSWSFTNGIIYNAWTVQSSANGSVALHSSGPITYTFSNNVIMFGQPTATVYALSFGVSPNGTVTNNVVTSVGNIGIAFLSFGGANCSSSGSMGTFSGNVVHSTDDIAVDIQNRLCGTMSGFKIWRNGNAGAVGGVRVSNNVGGLVLDNWTFFGNAGTCSCGMEVTGDFPGMQIINSQFSGDTTFSTARGIQVDGNLTDWRIDNTTFGVVSGIYTAHTTADITFASGAFITMVLRNTNLASATEFVNLNSNLQAGSYVGRERVDQTAGQQESQLPCGVLSLDTSTFHSSGYSEKLVPSCASMKLESGRRQYRVTNGGTVSVSVWVREDGSYNGNHARLIMKANPALGINTDVVAATVSVSATVWQLLTYTSPVATDDGVIEFLVDCDGTAGQVNDGEWAH